VCIGRFSHWAKGGPMSNNFAEFDRTRLPTHCVCMSGLTNEHAECIKVHSCAGFLDTALMLLQSTVDGDPVKSEYLLKVRLIVGNLQAFCERYGWPGVIE
jgi:hypothetical protein